MILALPALAVACDDGSPNPPDDDADVSDADSADGDVADGDMEPEECPAFDPFESGDEGASDLTVPPAAGGAVAGRITSADQLLTGLKPEGQVGDFLLANEHMAVVIEDARPSSGWGLDGGEILDIDLVDGEGPRGISYFDEIFFGVVPETVIPDEVAVLADGSDGGAAIVRVTGRLELVWLIGQIAPGWATTVLEFPVALDYVLEPGAEALTVRLTLRNNTTLSRMADNLLLVLVTGDGLDRFAPSVGFDDGTGFGVQDYVGLIGEELSYGWAPTGGGLAFLLAVEGVMIFGNPGTRLTACEDTTVDLGRLVVAGNDVSQLQAALRRVSGEIEPLAAITGSVTDGEGDPVAAARVHATDAEGNYLTMARADAEGRYRIEVEAGEVVVQAWSDSLRPSEAVTVTHTDSDATADLSMGSAGRIAWTVRDGDGVEIPAMVSVVPLDDPAPAAPAAFGEPTHRNDAVIHDYSLPGRRELPLAVGSYRVVASRGFEYELGEADVTVTAGATTEVELTLDHSVDSDGWLCGDFHIHTMYSPDSDDLVEYKVAAAAAAGLELPVSTDHRYVSNLQPTAEALGLDSWLQWFPGQEITTLMYGHFNAYPLPIRPDMPNDGTVEWIDLMPGELFASVREVSTDPVLQINHPRGSTISSYFTYVGLDPATLEATEEPAGWSLNFDAVEVFNDSGWNSNRDETVADWFGLLNNGELIVAMGNSDSHETEWDDVGYPRSCLPLDMAPSAVTEDILRDTIRAGRVVVSGGLFITVETPDGVGPGGVASASSGTATVNVRVQAPTWIDAENLEVIVNGETAETVTLDESTEDPTNPAVRLDRSFDIALDQDSWIVVGAWSTGALTPVNPGCEPFGATNAIFFDVDGDGEYRDSGRTVE